MTASHFLRIASGLTFVHAVLHTIGAVISPPEPGIQESTLALMKANQFPVMGMTRSYGDFYLGFGLFVTIAFLAESAIFWQLSNLVKSDAARLRPIMISFLLCYLGYTTIAFMYFFAAPAINEGLIAACLAMAVWKTGK